MKKIFYFVFLSVLIASCGEKSTDEDEPIVFTNTKDKISYVLGSMNAQTLVGSNDKNVMRLDMNVISEGFSYRLITLSQNSGDREVLFIYMYFVK